MNLLRHLVAILACAAALGASAQVAPTANYTDMWWNPNESGWGISIVQKRPAGGNVDTMFAVWYTYDPRAPDTTTSATTDFLPLWIVMPGGTWTSSRTFTGNLYVTVGSPIISNGLAAPWNAAALGFSPIGTFTFTFTDANNGTFTYNVTPPSPVASSDPAFGLPAFSGVKAITRQGF
jgi:hypothetical protein